MRKAILMMLLAVVSSSVAAAWVVVGDSGTDTLYADPATIRKAGNMVKMWSLLDYKTAKLLDNRERYMSTRTQNEYDCKEERWRVIYFSRHERNMGEGEIIQSDPNPASWFPVAPASGIEILWKIACGKR